MVGDFAGERAEFEIHFAVQGLGDFDHGFEGEIGVATEDFGDVGGGGADFFGKVGAGDAAGFHARYDSLGEADGGTFGVVGVGCARLVGFCFEGLEAGGHGVWVMDRIGRG